MFEGRKVGREAGWLGGWEERKVRGTEGRGGGERKAERYRKSGRVG